MACGQRGPELRLDRVGLTDLLGTEGEHHLADVLPAPVHQLGRGDGEVEIRLLALAPIVGEHADHLEQDPGQLDPLPQGLGAAEQLLDHIRPDDGDLPTLAKVGVVEPAPPSDDRVLDEPVIGVHRAEVELPFVSAPSDRSRDLREVAAGEGLDAVHGVRDQLVVVEGELSDDDRRRSPRTAATCALRRPRCCSARRPGTCSGCCSRVPDRTRATEPGRTVPRPPSSRS